jgi:arylsulfatase A-like enzyme
MLTAEGREYGGRKYITNDFGTRVPLIVRWPGRINSKQEVGDLVDLMDLMPTLIEAGGAELPQGVQIDGDSLLPTLIDGAPWDREALTFWYHPRPHAEGAAESRWARGQRFKLYGDGRLFDLDKDPLEGRPLLIDTASGPAQKARIKLQAHLDALPERPARVLSQ